jgi:prevent-host-death family protein
VLDFGHLTGEPDRKEEIDMPENAILRAPPAGERSLDDLPRWKLEDAKARFSEVVRRARSEGPQCVTRRGRNAVVVISTEELADLLSAPRTGTDLIAFLQQTGIGELEIEREEDRGRDIQL